MLVAVAAVVAACAWATTSLSSGFHVESLTCVDDGVHERYCPGRASPLSNAGYVPLRKDLRVKDGHLVPKYRRQEDDVIGLRFEYHVACAERDLFFSCVRGSVTVHVQPSERWDRPRSWWTELAELAVAVVLVALCGPLLVVFLLLSSGDKCKQRSFFSDD